MNETMNEWMDVAELINVYFCSLSKVTVDKHTWHHLCVSWSSQGGFWKIYKDGRLFDFDRWPGYEQAILGSSYSS